MITAVDTNILIDIFGANPEFGRRSLESLKLCAAKGAIIACDIVWVESATAFATSEQCLTAMKKISVEFSPTEEKDLWLAADAWRSYRNNGGKRERVVADFLIGAHALNQSQRFLTRDRGFYHQYFSDLIIISPADL